ncbi:MAG: DUF3987 domain-containing protein [Sediminimonas qiaohouensis]|uniref:DUF3987 domain-containing protein n=1 Tax=Sediminimonas qiaohouensis TaxID=552061 RepID=A0A7C9L8C2_9RHOB|nr:YfjI family protein [Sediminimonas qiaohouensis]MTJ04534.1 DUF3987 domain-containing protein [Sediminimonas qiaohouensis]
MNKPVPTITPEPFEPEWEEAAPHLLNPLRPAPPKLCLEDFFPIKLAEWIQQAAKAKGAPADYVLAGLLTVSASLIGNTRCGSPRCGWNEPTVLWSAVIGNPSAGKSPGLDATLEPLRNIEKLLRQEKKAEIDDWEQKSEVAKLAEKNWRKQVEAVLAGDGDEEIPAQPAEMDIPARPQAPRLSVNDATIERLSTLLAEQPRGTLQVRDELAGWMQNMERYGGSSDRTFWLEAYGGRSYTVERMGRPPITVDRLSIGVVGGAQPDRLASLMLAADDDGLLARFIVVWPHPTEITTPDVAPDSTYIEGVFRNLLSLDFHETPEGFLVPLRVPFEKAAELALDEFRRELRVMEDSVEGLLQSFFGKLPGLSVRISVVLAFLDWAAKSDHRGEVTEIGLTHFQRAKAFIMEYCLPMARRAYAGNGETLVEAKALRLIAMFRAQNIRQFSAREIIRLGMKGLKTGSDLQPVLDALVDGCIVRKVPQAAPTPGRKPRLYTVNPKVFEKTK